MVWLQYPMNNNQIFSVKIEIWVWDRVIRSSKIFVLGFEKQRLKNLPDRLKIFQNSYSKKMLEKFGFTDCTPVSSPIEERSATTDVNDMIEKNIFSIIKW